MNYYQQWGWHGHGCGCQQCCPPQECFPCPPTFPCALRGPIIGVTDGTFAKPGEVGEFLSGSNGNGTDMAYTPGVVSQAIVSPLSLPPGDWDVTCEFAAGYNFEDFAAGLTPLPQGASGPQFLNWGNTPPNTLYYMRGACNTIRVSTAVPVLLSYQVSAALTAASVSILTGLAGLTFLVTTSARRMR